MRLQRGAERSFEAKSRPRRGDGSPAIVPSKALPTPGPGEVRVRVAASALNPADYKVVLGTLKFLHTRNRPLIVGYDFSGTVEAVGPSVTDVSVGDDVFGFLPYGPGNKRGAFAESLMKSRPADLRLLASWPEGGLEVPLASTIPVREVAAGLRRLEKAGGRIAVRVAGGF
jgi:NADPH:quinone reductase-like Zn-dependent oxidoreductase